MIFALNLDHVEIHLKNSSYKTYSHLNIKLLLYVVDI